MLVCCVLFVLFSGCFLWVLFDFIYLVRAPWVVVVWFCFGYRFVWFVWQLVGLLLVILCLVYLLDWFDLFCCLFNDCLNVDLFVLIVVSGCLFLWFCWIVLLIVLFLCITRLCFVVFLFFVLYCAHCTCVAVWAFG